MRVSNIFILAAAAATAYAQTELEEEGVAPTVVAKIESIYSKLEEAATTLDGMKPMETEMESMLKKHASKWSTLISDENDAVYTSYEIERNEVMLSYLSTQTYIKDKPKETIVSLYGEYVSVLKEVAGDTEDATAKATGTAKVTQTSSGTTKASGTSSADDEDEDSEPASASAQPSGSGAEKVMGGLGAVLGAFVGVLAAM